MRNKSWNITSQPRFLEGLLFKNHFPHISTWRKYQKNQTPQEKEQKARFNMVLFEQSHMRTKIRGMNRRKERVPYAHPS